MINEHFPHRSRRGGDRICPNAPDEGTSRRVLAEQIIDLRGTRRARVRISKSDSGSKPKACGIRADSRLVFSCVKTNAVHEIEVDRFYRLNLPDMFSLLSTSGFRVNRKFAVSLEKTTFSVLFCRKKKYSIPRFELKYRYH